MVISKLTASLAGPCRHCGKPAGLIKRVHQECKRVHQEGWNQMVQLSAAQAAGDNNLSETALRSALGEIAQKTYWDKPSMLTALVDGWIQGVPRTKDGGIITQREGLFPAGKPSGPRPKPFPVPPRQHAISGGYSPRQYMINVDQRPPTDQEMPTVQITLELLVDAAFFQTEQAEEAEELARRIGGRVYSWKTAGKHNWLEAGYSRVDVIGLAVLPVVLPQTVTMPNDSIVAD